MLRLPSGAPGIVDSYFIFTGTGCTVGADEGAGSAEFFSAYGKAPQDPAIVAAGDIACSSTNTTDPCRESFVSNLFAGSAATIPNPTAVLTLGDNQYEDGTNFAYTSPANKSYNDTWGQKKPITYPSPGNHEYNAGPAAGYCAYFTASPAVPLTGCIAGDLSTNASGFYSYDIGNWHLISLDTGGLNCVGNGQHYNGPACDATSQQVMWLQADIAAQPDSKCVLAYFHDPRFSSGSQHHRTAADNVVPALWNAFYNTSSVAKRVDVVLNGHSHNYELFAKQTPAGVADDQGVREFVVGTGGKNLHTFGSTVTNSLKRLSEFGLLKLTLHQRSYSWEFIKENGTSDGSGGTVDDSGIDACH